MNDNALAVLGLHAHDERVYRTLLRAPGIAAPEVASACGLPLDTAHQVLERLQHLGVVTRRGQDTFHGTDPHTVFDHLSQRRLVRLQSQIRQIAAAHSLMGSLLPDRRAPERDVERIEGLEQILDRIDALAFSAHDECLTTHPGPIITAALDTVSASNRRHLRRGLRMRTVLHTAALDDERVRAHAGDLTGLGAAVRATDRPLGRIVLFDRTTALVAADPRDITAAALIVRHPGLVAQLLDLFEQHWECARPLLAPRPTATDRDVLRTMAGAGKDETGARALGISVRTYRSRIADLMRRLGADSRFQAALKAREQGWI
ncbi:helix-turn-helix domain-containing protein [Kitasatospora sp. NPDC001664]